MNAPAKIATNRIDWTGCGHWHTDLPYRALVPIKRHSPSGPMLYQVAGSSAAPCGAEKALRAAMAIHGGHCFYCAVAFKPKEVDWTLDHVEAEALGGNSQLPNLVIACKPCNSKKGHHPIDSFNPDACAAWLKALTSQIEERLARLKST